MLGCRSLAGKTQIQEDNTFEVGQKGRAITGNVARSGKYREEPVTDWPGMGNFFRHIVLRLVLVWLFLLLLSYQFFLVQEEQLLTHPLEVFAQRAGLAVHTVKVEVMVRLPEADSFTSLKSPIMRLGRILGAEVDSGLLQATVNGNLRNLKWQTKDRQGRQLVIQGESDGAGEAYLLIQATEWGPTCDVRALTARVTIAAGRMGPVISHGLEVQGIMARLPEPHLTAVERWIGDLHPVRLQVWQQDKLMRVTGISSLLGYGRTPAPFEIVINRAGHNQGRLTICVGNFQSG